MVSAWWVTMYKKWMVLLIVTLPLGAAVAASGDNTLVDIGFTNLPGDRAIIKLTFTQPPSAPLAFTIDNPARVAFDLPGVATKLAKKNQNVGLGAVRSISAVEAKGRSRVVFNLTSLVAYDTKIEGNTLLVTFGSMVAATSVKPTNPVSQERSGESDAKSINSVDFRRGREGEGRLTVVLSDKNGVVDIKEEGDKIIATFPNTTLPQNLQQRLDVIDFATPVNYVNALAHQSNTVIEIETQGVFTLEIKPVKPEEVAKKEKEKFGYTGEKLSLNFQNIEVRAVLQLIADFTGLNLIASDTVTGNVTLRLKSVPWDQALDIVLKTKGLAMRQMGNVLLVAPAEEIASREKQELEAEQQIRQLEPLRTEIIQVNYAKASDFASLLKAQESTLLSERGSVTVDERTNTLLVQDTSKKLVEVRKLVSTLDIPIRQVLIESRVVIANDNFTKDLGVRFGGTAVDPQSKGLIGITGSGAGVDTMVNSGLTNIATGGNAAPVALPSFDNRMGVNLPAAGGGRIGFGILGPDYLIDLELSAMQKEGQGEVLSNPRVITGNQKEAFIEQGVEIPYQEASSSGATSISFKKAVLSLKVTPQITPDDRIIMDLSVNKDSVGQIYFNVPSINTREINTQVLVENGDTVVLGGILEQNISEDVSKVPVLGDIPLLGRLFRKKTNVDNKEELLVFITPKILKENLRVR